MNARVYVLNVCVCMWLWVHIQLSVETIIKNIFLPDKKKEQARAYFSLTEIIWKD